MLPIVIFVTKLNLLVKIELHKMFLLNYSDGQKLTLFFGLFHTDCESLIFSNPRNI